MVLRSSSSVFLFHASSSCVKEESRLFQLNNLQLSVSLSALAPVNVVSIQKKKKAHYTNTYIPMQKPNTSHFQKPLTFVEALL